MTGQPPYGAGPPFGAGGSFLGTAASAAAGAIGGGLLLNGIRSMFGHRAGGGDPFAFGGQHQDSELAHSHGGDNDLARQAGVDDIHDQHDRQDQDDPDAADESDDDAFDTGDADDDGGFDDDDGGAGGDDSYDV